MSEFTQGLTLSGIGILITFSALGILILLIQGLKTLFPAGVIQDPDLQGEETNLSRERLKETAAAVGVATLMKTQGFGKGNLGRLLEEPRGSWWKANRDRMRGKE